MSELETQVIKVDPFEPEKEVITKAAEVIRRGGLVAFPTETVYGIGADALNHQAVERIFQAKGRPGDNPIIVHVAEMGHLEILTDEVSPRASELVNRFWPGPLTLIYARSDKVPKVVTGGGDTIAVRMPKSEVALALIRAFGGPIAAPSANISGYLSSTTGMHVFGDLKGKVDLILDAGPVEVGVESTVLDITSSPPTILRPGAVTAEELVATIGEVILGKDIQLMRRSPGTRYRHYSPKAEVILVKEKEILGLIGQHIDSGKKVGLITHHAYPDNEWVTTKAMPQDLREYARKIFAALRELDEQGIEHIIIEEVEEKGIGVAIMDRLRRAAAH
jgi:L-threonylcarbamoyladenylate synthase